MVPRTEATGVFLVLFEGNFPTRIPASSGKFLVIREFHAVHECVFFPTHPGLAGQLAASQKDSAREGGCPEEKCIKSSAHFSLLFVCVHARI